MTDQSSPRTELHDLLRSHIGPVRGFGAQVDKLVDRIIESEAQSLSGYGGIIAVLDNAKREGWPVHVATRTTCAEHIDFGDEKGAFAFGQEAQSLSGEREGMDGRSEVATELLDAVEALLTAEPKSYWLRRRDVRRLRDAHNAVVALASLPTEPWKVHNHGPDQGRGTACREYHLNGRLVGACKITEATEGTNESHS